jgi:pimeloyl-ACP methyl ester carboxylesterase
MHLRVNALLAITLLTGCASLPDTQVKLVDARQVEVVEASRSDPTVVFENGLGGKMELWRKVLPEVAKDSSYFAYNRPGYRKSAPADTPRDGSHVVEELRAVLRSEGIKPPYVLVGHSLGGLYMQLFARKYPDEVAALVLVDSTHPKQLEGEGAIEKRSFWIRSLVSLLVTGTAKEELSQLTATGEQVLKLPTLTGKPVFVLSASEPMKATSKLAQFANEKRVDIARMYPGSKQIWVDSGHAIPLEKPEAVVAAIRAALIEARQLKQGGVVHDSVISQP